MRRLVNVEEPDVVVLNEMGAMMRIKGYSSYLKSIEGAQRQQLVLIRSSLRHTDLGVRAYG